MDMLGGRIRDMRKQKGLTQTELAGNELTKSMLSQIENGKAVPSMKTLHYLANQLGCEPSYFLESEEEGLAGLVQTAQDLEKKKDYKELYRLLQEKREAMQGTAIDTARLLELFAEACIRLHPEEAGGALAGAVRIYERFSLYRESTQAKLRMDLKLVKEGKFHELLQLLEDTREYYQQHTVARDVLLELKMYYGQVLALLAVGRYEEGMALLLQTLEFSKEHETYYRADDLCRIAAYHAIAYGDHEGYERYVKKSERYAAFTESKRSLGNLELIRAFYCNEMAHDHEQALLHLADYRGLIQEDEMYQLERGKALYHLGRIEEALQSLQQVKIPAGMYHPLDHGWLHSAGVYRALCYQQLGQEVHAQREAEAVLERIQELPDSPHTMFIRNVAGKLKA